MQIMHSSDNLTVTVNGPMFSLPMNLLNISCI